MKETEVSMRVRCAPIYVFDRRATALISQITWWLCHCFGHGMITDSRIAVVSYISITLCCVKYLLLIFTSLSIDITIQALTRYIRTRNSNWSLYGSLFYSIKLIFLFVIQSKIIFFGSLFFVFRVLGTLSFWAIRQNALNRTVRKREKNFKFRRLY